MIEDIIQNNRDLFEEDLPEGHLKRFENKLNTASDESRRTVLNKLLVAAASVVVIITIGFIIMLTSDSFSANDYLLANITPELYEAEAYYQNKIHQKMDILSNQNNVDKSILKDLREIDKSFDTIKKDLDKNPGDERLISAILSTYQIKLDLINEILERIH
ncbi:MAG: hypothetical protein JXB24_13530 [Bacteroidales bacterium]|nr:hypothetical protein [Bacteroidales bacterium]